jgi:hypothetical protein
MAGSLPGRSRTYVVIAAATGFLLAACTNSHAVKTAASGKPLVVPGLPSPSPVLPATIQSDPIVAVVKRVTPAVVNVTSSTLTQDALGGVQPGKGVGTGSIIRSDGVIVTNFHSWKGR